MSGIVGGRPLIGRVSAAVEPPAVTSESWWARTPLNSIYANGLSAQVGRRPRSVHSRKAVPTKSRKAEPGAPRGLADCPGGVELVAKGHRELLVRSKRDRLRDHPRKVGYKRPKREGRGTENK